MDSCYMNGTGVTPDTELAIKWFNEAGSKGIASAYVNLGTMHSDGSSAIPEDYSLAKQYYSKALELDPHQGTALSSLGGIYYSEKEYLKAAELFLKAAREGDTDANDLIHKFNGDISLDSPSSELAELLEKYAKP